METIGTERVLTVHHWNPTVFSFTTTRDIGLRFENDHFVMLGLMVNGKPLIVTGGCHPRWERNLGTGDHPATSPRLKPSYRTIDLASSSLMLPVGT